MDVLHVDYEIADSMVIMRASGPFNMAVWHITLERLMADPDFLPRMPILCDVRAGTEPPSPSDVFPLAQAWRELVPDHFVALVVKRYGAQRGVGAQLCAVTSEQLQVFLDTHEAVEWLHSRARAADTRLR